MQMTWRLLVAAGLVAASQLTVIAICGRTESTPAHLPAVGPTTLPKVIGDFTGRDEPLDEHILSATGADAMLNRVFRNRLGDTVFANVSLWTQSDMGIPHKPDQCYPSAGWEIVSRRMLDVPLSSGKTIQVKQFVFQRGTDRIAVAFWVHLGDEIVTESEGVRSMRQRLRKTGGPLPLLVKVMLHTEARDIAQAEARLSRFIAALEPYTQSIH
jgi:EpsI family protein